MASGGGSPGAAVLSPGRRQSMLKRLSDLNPFRSPGAESAGSEEDEDAEYEQLKKDVIANTRRLVLEPFIIATAAAVGLNFGHKLWDVTTSIFRFGRK